MDIFEITIQHRLEIGWPVVAERTRPAQLPLRSEGRLALAGDYEADLLSKQFDARDYGETLGQALFQGTLRDSYMAARAEAEAAEQPLHVLLVVEDPDLKPLRWERLCAPDGSAGWDFLALNQRSLYSLYLPSLTDRSFPAISRRDLRALVVLADPPKDNKYRLDSFDAGAMATSIGTALGEIPRDLLGSVPNAVGPATLDALCEQITAEHYTLLHLVAHGQYLHDGETVLFLLDIPDPKIPDLPPQVAPVTATELIRRLGRLRGSRGLPHLTFLATCESANPEAEAETALGGLAQRLVRNLGMPAVVAMTDRISIATAEQLFEPFYTQLRQHGQVDRALVEAGAGMQGRDDILVPALYSRLAGRPLFSDELGEREILTDSEIRYGLERLGELLPDRAPVLEDRFAASAKAVRAIFGGDEQALSAESREERAQALDDLNALSEEVLDLSFPALVLDQRVPDYKAGRCPFPGLKAFQTDDQAFFFGRDDAVRTLLKRLGSDRFLAVLGISGSGKSSLVLAGMVPKLIQANQTLDHRVMTPGPNPEATLAKQLEPPLPAGQPALLVVDQFEELFTLSSDAEARGRFLDHLLQLGKDHPELHTILTLRADFWGDCAPFEDFRQQMQVHQELLPPMTLAELRSAMEQQAASVGLRFEADLSHTILDEVKGEPGAMPLLQHLLRELWKRRHGRWLRASEYRKLGGIKQAIAHTADEIYKKLVKQDPGGKDLMRNLFVRLTRLDEKSEGEDQHRDTRLRVPFDDLVPTGSDSDSVRRLVQCLADARLLVITSDQNKQKIEVEVSHEALIRHWPRLRTWLDEDRGSWVLLAAVRQQAKTWRQNGQKDGDLPRWGERLQQAEVLFHQERLAQTELEGEFIQAAKGLWQSEKQQKKIWVLIGLAATAIFVAVILYFWADAVDNLAQAQANHRRTTAHRLALTAEGLIDENPQLGILLAAEGIRVTQRAGEDTVVEARDTLIRLLGRFTARPLARGLAGSNYAAFTPDGSSIVFADDMKLSILGLDPSGLTESLVSIPWSEGMIHHTYGPIGAWFMAQSQSEDRRKTDNYVIDMTSKEATNVEMRPHSLSVDGRWLIVVDEQRAVLLVDTRMSTADLSGIQVGEHWGELRDLALSENGLWLAMLDRDLSPQLVDLRKHANGETDVVQPLSESRGIRLLRFSRNGRWLAAADTDAGVSVSGAKIDLWRLDNNTWRIARDKSDFFRKGIALLEVSPRGNWMGIVGWKAGDNGDSDRYLSLWHLGDKGFRQQLQLPEEVNHVAFSNDDHWIAAASRFDSTVRVWDLTDYAEAKRDGRQLHKYFEFDVKGRGVSSLRFLQSRNSLLVLAERPQVWHLDVGNPPQELDDFLGRRIGPGKFVVSPIGDWMVTLGDDGPPWLWMFGKPSGRAEASYSKIGETELLGFAAQVAGRNLMQAEWSKYLAGGEADASPGQTFEEFADPAREN